MRSPDAFAEYILFHYISEALLSMLQAVVEQGF
jgi:hypothetical protein